MAGLNAYYGDADETRFQNIDATPGARIVDRNLYALTSEAYAEIDQNVAESLYVVGALQESYDTRDIDQTFPTAAHQNEIYEGYNPRIGLRYDVNAGAQLFTNLSRSFEPPSWNELSGGNVPGFHQLKAQTAKTAELGGRGTYENMHWEAAYYHGWMHNELVDYEYATGVTSTVNVAHSTRNGIELGAYGDAARGLLSEKDAINVRGAYTFNDFRLDRDPLYGNNRLPGVPENYLRAEVLYVFGSGISLGPNVEWSPTPSPVDLASSLRAPGYAICGARLFWQSPDEKWNFYIDGRNLLNAHYVATTNVVPNANGTDGNYFYPGEGRAIYAGMSWRL